MEIQTMIEAGKLFYSGVIQPCVLVYIALQLRYMRKSMASHKDVKIAIADHSENCPGHRLEIVTPTKGKGNGHAVLQLD